MNVHVVADKQTLDHDVDSPVGLYAPLPSPRREHMGPTAASILSAAVDLFSQRGYHGTSMRDIADQVGIRPGALYNHFLSKQDILVYVIDTQLTDLYNGVIERLRETRDPVEELRKAIKYHVLLHGTHSAEMLIADNEIPALSPNHRRLIIGKRKRYERLFQDILQRCKEEGRFRPFDVQIVSYAIIGMATQVATWFDSGGRCSIEEIGEMYWGLVYEGLKEGSLRQPQ